MENDRRERRLQIKRLEFLRILAGLRSPGWGRLGSSDPKGFLPSGQH